MSRPDRFTAVWWAVLAAIALALCGMPLFDLLGFEFAFAISIPLTFYAGHCGVRARRATPGRPWQSARTAARAALIASLWPLAIITANALRVQNCNYLEGLAFYAIITATGAIVAAGWGAAIGGVFARRGYAIFIAGVLATLALAGHRFWFDPPVDLFHPFFGYWPGALYDDVLVIDDRLIWSRFEDLAIAAAALAGTTLPSNLRWRPALIAAAAIGLAAFARHGATRHAVHRDAEWITTALGAVTVTEHLRIVHPATWTPDDRRLMTTELEFAYAELRAFFGFETSRPITIWLHPDETTKKRLMGARRVRIAKPWQWAFHVHAPAIGQSVLVHEMAHVFSAEIADAPHHLSLYRGTVPHMPLIEGLAEAATWKTDRLDLHQWSAAMHRIGVAPPLAELLAPAGFYRRNARTAYTLCGSFARHYHDTHGPGALAAAYRAGTFETAGADLPSLIADWQAFLTAQPLPDHALAYAEARFDHPSIFGRACAHEIAALRNAAATALPRDALHHIEAILHHQPDDIPARLAYADLLAALDRPSEARTIARALADDPRAGAIARAAARERLADLAALAGDPDTARPLYAQVDAIAFERADLRRLAVKRAALEAGEAGRHALAYLADQSPEDPYFRGQQLDALVDADPDWAPGRYLRGRFLLATQPTLALIDLSAAAPHLTDPSLRFEIARMIAAAAFDAGCYPQAATRFAHLADRTDLDLTPGERAALATWTRRSTFFAAHAAPDPAPADPPDLASPTCADIDINSMPLDDAPGPAE